VKAQEYLSKEEFEQALKELERVLYHKMQEKFQLVKTVSSQDFVLTGVVLVDH
jgi:tryptophan 2,3-dioxygenase